MRTDRLARAVLIVGALGAAACTVEATGLFVTLDVRGGLVVQRIAVEVREGSRVVAEGAFADRAVATGDTFGVRLSDELDGKTVDLTVRAFDAAAATVPVATGTASAKVVRHGKVDVMVLLTPGGVLPDLAGTDGPIDMAMLPDLTVQDLSRADLTVVDMVDMAKPPVVDMAQIDLRPPPCAEAVPLPMQNGANPGNLAGGNSKYTGSCQGGGTDKSEQLWGFSLGTWSTVQLGVTQAAFQPRLYVRTSCAVGATDFPIRQPCLQANAQAGPLSCAAGLASMTLCALPPGDYVAYVDGDAPGAYTLDVKTTSNVALNTADCSLAGLLIPPYQVEGTTVGKGNNHAAGTALNCGPAGDQGKMSNEQVFWFVARDPWKSATITARSLDGANFKPLLYVRQTCSAGGPEVCDDSMVGGAGAAQVTKTNPGGVLKDTAYYVFVDGQQQTAGRFSLKVDVQ